MNSTMVPHLAKGILLIYHQPLVQNAPTILEHVSAFPAYSRFRVWTVNTELGFPDALAELKFSVIVIHYSTCGWYPYSLPPRFRAYVREAQDSYKIAFFQDEHRYWPQRSEFIKDCRISCVYTLVEPPHFGETYQKRTSVETLIYTLPGYVSEELVQQAQRFSRPSSHRTIDIGYRGRILPHWMGRGSQEKHVIAERFRELAQGMGFKLDVESEEHKRLYGRRYYEFLGNCKAVLGVEAGVSIFDIDDVARPAYEHLAAERPHLTFEEAYRELLWRYEDNIYYRTISPRHFEAAAFRVCQILFEGQYSGILEPMIHYIPLKKDFSNFGDVVRAFRDDSLREMLIQNAYRDLIVSGQYSYRRFVEDFDAHLISAGCDPAILPAEALSITALLKRGELNRWVRGAIRSLHYRPFPGRAALRAVVRPVLRQLRQLGLEWI
jgi:hypothetical protein